jgi:thiamine biosynthesis lipoprotein
MNRRDFLRPGHLVRGAGQVAGLVDEVRRTSVEGPPPAAALLQFARNAMATTFEVLLPFGSDNALQAAEDALDEIDRLEAQLTVYRDSSEVSQLNRQASVRPVRVEERLFDLLWLAQEIQRDSGGAFDIAIGALIKAWGFYRRRGAVPAAEERSEVLTRCGMHNVVLDPDTKSVAYLRPGLEINLGSIGKGHALDRAAERLAKSWNIAHALLHGGHSSMYALGSQPGTQRGWLVDIRHPEVPDQRLAALWLCNRGLGSSAATYQHLLHEGRKLGHILDPRSGWPAEGMLSATATAPSAAQADALATAFFILGAEKTREYCETHPDIGAFLLPHGAERPLILGHAMNEIT